MELFERIRRDRRREDLSIRELAERYRVHRRTVRQALASAVPPSRKMPERECPKLGRWKPVVRAWLEADRKVPRKQRHTARRVWQRLVEEHGAEVAESTVRGHVAEVKAELANDLAGVAVPQHHGLGEEAEVDFGESVAFIDGVLEKVWVFSMRLSASGRAFHRAFSNQSQEAFFEGHVGAFEHFGGVPIGQIRYDNLKPAVARVLMGRKRVESERFVVLRSHYGFDAFYCRPGKDGAHEKGGVEGDVGRFRRRHLVPVPVVSSLAELNEAIAAADAADDGRSIEGRTVSVGEHFESEREHLAALPGEAFEAAVELSARVDHKARIPVRQSYYSVPARYARRRLRVLLGASELSIFDGAAVVARHPRALHRGEEHLVLDHYLEVLTRKPGALSGAAALHQARASGAFTEAHDAYWTLARRRLGDKEATLALIEVLLAHRHLNPESLVSAMEAAVRAGIVDPHAVIIEARRAAGVNDDPVVVPIGELARFDRPAPALSGYDTLLEATR